MPPPSRQVMYKIRGTFADFLKRNKLESLIPIFTVTHTVFGYGYLDEVAALYGLIWNTPKLMKGFMGRQRSNGKQVILWLQRKINSMRSCVILKTCFMYCLSRSGENSKKLNSLLCTKMKCPAQPPHAC